MVTDHPPRALYLPLLLSYVPFYAAPCSPQWRTGGVYGRNRRQQNGFSPAAVDPSTVA